MALGIADEIPVGGSMQVAVNNLVKDEAVSALTMLGFSPAPSQKVVVDILKVNTVYWPMHAPFYGRCAMPCTCSRVVMKTACYWIINAKLLIYLAMKTMITSKPLNILCKSTTA